MRNRGLGDRYSSFDRGPRLGLSATEGGCLIASALYVLVYLALLAGVVYVAWHFIQKLW